MVQYKVVETRREEGYTFLPSPLEGEGARRAGEG